MARKANITVQTLSNIERGKVCLEIEKLHHISKIFHVSPAVILEMSIEVFETERDDWLPSAIKAIMFITLETRDDDEV